MKKLCKAKYSSFLISHVKDKDLSYLFVFFMKSYQKLVSQTFGCPVSFNWEKKQTDCKICLPSNAIKMLPFIRNMDSSRM